MTTLTGQIGLVVPGTSALSRAIAWWTRSPVSHAVVALSETDCVGSEPGGAKVRPISYFGGDVIWSQFHYTVDERAAVVAWATAHIGTPYSYLTDAAIAVSFLLHNRTPKWIEEYLSSDQVLECAELADMALQSAGIHLFTDGRLPGTVYPGSFVQFFRTSGWWPSPYSRRRAQTGRKP
jgi:hypothetical protein